MAHAQGTFPVNGTQSPDKTTYAITNARFLLNLAGGRGGRTVSREGKIIQAGKKACRYRPMRLRMPACSCIPRSWSLCPNTA